LQKEGYKVLEAENGQEAIDSFLLNKPDMILLDIMMPVMDGLTACQNIKKLPGGNKIPILMFTGLDDGKSVEMAFQAGASDFITKPINWEELRYRVLRLIHMRNMEETVQRQLYYDSLTNLPNRTLFKDRLTVAINQAAWERSKLAVIFMNIKNFSLVNDAFGYDQGDNLIRGVANRLNDLVDKEVTVSRMGGDDFAFIVSKITDGNEVIRLADQIIKTISKPWIVNNQEINIAVDIGISLYPNDGEDEQTLLKNAETAMSRASALNRNVYSFYNQQMNSSALERIAFENDLRYVIAKNELVVHYQPKVNCETGEITGVEALVRWQNPERGMVGPMEFIPIAEEMGMIVQIGEWVLNTACVQVRKWHEQGHKLSLSVNFSAMQFQQPNLSQLIHNTLVATGFDSKYLTVEITESVAMNDVNFTIKILSDLKSMGVDVSIDDFGTGYSSLSYLKRLPISELKIDRSFVHDITTNQEDAAIVDMIIVLGQTLKLNIVAEGVETQEQLEFLKNRKCTEIQGYLLSKPLPADEFERVLLS
jgi:diguanylate cyclase (GGDEF)-like protein